MAQPGWSGVGGPRGINPLKDDGTLIKYVSNLTELAAPGEADDALMAFQHRLCVSGDPTDVPWGRVPWPKPPNYDPDDFLIMQRAIEAGDSSPYQDMPPSMMRASASGACKKKKYTVCCGISVVASDQPTLNKGWANATWERKQEIIADHTYLFCPICIARQKTQMFECLHLQSGLNRSLSHLEMAGTLSWARYTTSRMTQKFQSRFARSFPNLVCAKTSLRTTVISPHSCTFASAIDLSDPT